MGRFQRILYLERRRRGSMRALSCAVHAAVRHGASLTLAGQTSAERLVRMAELAELFDLSVRCRRLPPGEAIRADLAAGHDLVITVGRMSGSGSPRHLDDVERSLLRGCGCPVWILHPAQSPEPRVVVAAVDVGRPDRGALNRSILRSAAGLAEDTGAELHVVHCWMVVGESLLSSRTRGGSRRGAERVLAEAERRRRDQVAALLESSGVAGAHVVLRKAGVVAGLREVAWRLEADILVVGSAGRTGLAALFPGNTTERLMGRVPASLFVVPKVPNETARGARGPLHPDPLSVDPRPGPWRQVPDGRPRVS